MDFLQTVDTEVKIKEIVLLYILAASCTLLLATMKGT